MVGPVLTMTGSQRHFRITGDHTDRWADVSQHEFRRSGPLNTYTIALSDGRAIGGELPHFWAMDRAVRWVKDGK